MHDLLLALAFVAMILTPCIVAAVGGKESSEASAPKEKEQIAAKPTQAMVIDQPAKPKTTPRVRPAKVWVAQTLPIHRTLGMANR
jgi:hypothetical protein